MKTPLRVEVTIAASFDWDAPVEGCLPQIDARDGATRAILGNPEEWLARILEWKNDPGAHVVIHVNTRLLGEGQ